MPAWEGGRKCEGGARKRAGGGGEGDALAIELGKRLLRCKLRQGV